MDDSVTNIYNFLKLSDLIATGGSTYGKPICSYQEFWLSDDRQLCAVYFDKRHSARARNCRIAGNAVCPYSRRLGGTDDRRCPKILRRSLSKSRSARVCPLREEYAGFSVCVSLPPHLLRHQRSRCCKRSISNLDTQRKLAAVHGASAGALQGEVAMGEAESETIGSRFWFFWLKHDVERCIGNAPLQKPYHFIGIGSVVGAPDRFGLVSWKSGNDRVRRRTLRRIFITHCPAPITCVTKKGIS